MEGVGEDNIPCSSIAVDSFLRLGMAGSIWGMFLGPYEAKKRGLTSASRASFVVKSVGKYGFQCGLFGGLFSATQCGVRKYRMEKDWVNDSIAGAVTGAVFAAKTRSWLQMLGTAVIVSTVATAAEYSRTI